MMNRRPIEALGIVLALPFFACTEIVSALAPRAEPLERWRAHDPSSELRVEHGAWAQFLERFGSVKDGIRRIDYAAALEERSKLDTYLTSLTTIDPRTLRRDEQLAFWINLYNAETVSVVLDHYPVDSIKDIDLEGGGLFGGPWNAQRLEITGTKLSLNDIEHGILRPLWGDPRIHYAVNCASLGCPNVAAEPFRGATVGAQLDAQARDFINHSRGVRFENGELRLSRIYQWYRDDFGDDDAAVIAHLRLYASSSLSEALAGQGSIDDYAYDWRLNAPSTPYP